MATPIITAAMQYAPNNSRGIEDPPLYDTTGGLFATPAGPIKYVNPTSGADTNAGTAIAPYKTIGKAKSAIDASGVNSSILVAMTGVTESICRESFPPISAASHVTRIQPVQGAKVWWDGADDLLATHGGSFVHNPGGAPSTGWQWSGSYTPAITDTNTPGTRHADQVFRDNVPLVAKTTVNPGAGQFYVDKAAHKLYLGDDPTGHLIEVSWRDSVTGSGTGCTKPGLIVRGFGIRRYSPNLNNSANAMFAMRGAVAANPQHLDHMVLAYSGCIGLDTTSSAGLIMDELVIVNSEALDWHNFLSTAGHATNVRLDRANWEAGFTASGPIIANAKWAQCNGWTLDNILIRHGIDTTCNGLWLDVLCANNTITRLAVKDIGGSGLFLEVSGAATIVDFLATRCRVGLRFGGTTHPHIESFTLVDNDQDIWTYEDSRTPTANSGTHLTGPGDFFDCARYNGVVCGTAAGSSPMFTSENRDVSGSPTIYKRQTAVLTHAQMMVPDPYASPLPTPQEDYIAWIRLSNARAWFSIASPTGDFSTDVSHWGHKTTVNTPAAMGGNAHSVQIDDNGAALTKYFPGAASDLFSWKGLTNIPGTATSAQGRVPTSAFAASVLGLAPGVKANMGCYNPPVETPIGAAGNLPPNAAFSTSKSGLAVSGDATASSDPDGSITFYGWNWGDGLAVASINTSTDVWTFTGTAPTTGSGRFRFRASPGGITVTGTALDATTDYWLDPATGKVYRDSGHTSLVDVTGSTAPSATLDFRDSGVTASHTYTAAGTYTITLTVIDDGTPALSDTATANVTVSTSGNIAPTASFASTANGLDLSVDGSSSSDPDGTIVSYDWDWGDGSSHGSGATATRRYAVAGTYAVTLTVTDNGAATGTKTINVTVVNLPPTGQIVTPSDNDPVTGTNQVVGVTAEDPDGTVSTVDLYVDGTFDHTITLGGFGWLTVWDTTPYTNGVHALTALITDSAGGTFITSPVHVDVANFDPPTINWNRPPTPNIGATESGVLTFQVDAVSSTAIVAVDLILDAGQSGAQTIAMHSVAGSVWNVAVNSPVALADGGHTATARATDAGGLSSQLPPFSFNVNNAGGGGGGGGGGGAPRPHFSDEPLSDWVIFVRGWDDQAISQFSRIGMIRGLLQMKLNKNAPGGWTLACNYADPGVDLLLRAGSGIVLTYKGQVVASGPRSEDEHQWEPAKSVITFAGVTEEFWLAARIAHQAPADLAPDGSGNWSQAQDVFTGIAEDAIVHFADVNLGPNAITARQVPGMRVPASAGRGPSGTWRATGQMLDTLIKEIADVAGLTVTMRGDELGPYLRVDSPVDRSRSVMFSPDFGNLQTYTYMRRVPIANHMYGAGSGSGAARVWAEAEDAGSIATYGRIESVFDASQATTVAEVTTDTQAALVDAGNQEGVKTQPIDMPNARFLDDYRMGDQVSVFVDNAIIVDTINGVQITIDPQVSGGVARVFPTIGDQVLRSVSASQVIRRLSKRVTKIEVLH